MTPAAVRRWCGAQFVRVAAALLLLSGVVVASADQASAQDVVAGPYVVDVSSREDVRRFYQTVYRAADGIAPGWTGGDLATCTPGTLSAPYLDATVSRVNWFRAMAGVSSTITFTAEKNALAQAAGVLQATRPAGAQIDHNPPATWRCFSAAGFAGSQQGNIGGTGPGSIDGYMADAGANNAATGHRRWVLGADRVTMGHGGVPNDRGTLHVLGERATPRPIPRDTFVAWPAPGFVPSQVTYSRWSFSLPPSANVDNAAVSVQRNGAAVPLQLLVRESNSGFGDSIVTWRPTTVPDDSVWPRPAADETYTVTVSGVVVDGVARTFTYATTIFDADVAAPGESVPVISGPLQPPVATEQPFTFTTVPRATGYQWRSTRVTPLTLADGAEGGLTNFTATLGTGPTNQAYDPVSTLAPATGTAGFRLTSSEGGGPQSLTLNRRVVPGATSQLRFSTRAELLDNHLQRVEVSDDGGVTWVAAFDQVAPVAREGRYSPVTVPLARFAGKVIQVRFSLVQVPRTSTWTCCGLVGWYFDDITFDNLEQADASVLSPLLPANTTGFSFTAPDAAAQLLQARAQYFGSGFVDWGPVLRVRPIAPPTAPTITTQPASRTVDAGSTMTLSVAATGTPLPTFSWRRDGQPLADGNGVSGATTATLSISPAVAGTYTVLVSNAGGTVTSAAAVVTLAGGSNLADAVDAQGTLVTAITTSGNAPWNAQQAVTHDGVDAARSGPVANLQSSVLRATVQGPGTLSFWWRVDSELNFDFLSVAVDGAAAADRISGPNVAWAEKRIELTAGTHTVTWTYSKDVDTVVGLDAGWVDQVAVTPTTAPPTTAPPTTPLQAALNTNLGVTSGGTALWISQTAVSRDGSAAQSGRVADLQKSTLTMSVNGPATLAFWWRVDSETNFDFLTVFVDDQRVDRISGRVEWAERQIPVTAGAHSIRWEYSKDVDTTAGADAGWVDLVRLF